MNAHAERFVRSIEEECLSQIIPLGERHLRRAVAEFTEHFHVERNHQGLGNELIEQSGEMDQGRVACRERLCGLLKYNSSSGGVMWVGGLAHYGIRFQAGR